MATDRIYLVNTRTKEYACFGKLFSSSWGLGNVDILKKLMDSSGFDEFMLVHESDDELWDKYIKNGINLNESNKWEYYELV